MIRRKPLADRFNCKFGITPSRGHHWRKKPFTLLPAPRPVPTTNLVRSKPIVVLTPRRHSRFFIKKKWFFTGLRALRDSIFSTPLPRPKTPIPDREAIHGKRSAH